MGVWSLLKSARFICALLPHSLMAVWENLDRNEQKQLLMARAKALCVIVEPREHPALGAALQSLASSGVCDGMIILHGTQNTEHAKLAAQSAKAQAPSTPFTLHKLGEVSDLTKEEYSDLLYTPAFWNALQKADVTDTDRALIFQTDSGVCALDKLDEKSSKAFLRAQEYEMCGAPYGHHCGVNGGFSTRSISASKRALIEHEPPSGREVPEDVFFSRHLGVCPYDVALAFSNESVMGQNVPFGFHAPWKGDIEIVNRLSDKCPQMSIIHRLNTAPND